MGFIRPIHIEENITPETYPPIFRPVQSAPCGLEVNAFSVDAFKVQVGDMVTIPASLLPEDLQDKLIKDAFLQN